MAKYIFRCANNKRVSCNVGYYCIGHSDFCTDSYTADRGKATVYGDSANDDIIEIENIMECCAGMFEQIEVTE